MQRRVADLEAAGLNPVLAAGGSGAANSGPIHLNAPQFEAPDLGRAYSAMIAHNQANMGQANLKAAEASASVADINARVLEKQYQLASDMTAGMSPLVWAPMSKMISEMQAASAAVTKAEADAAAAKSTANILARTDRLGEKWQEGQIIAGLLSTGASAAVNGLKGGLLLAPK